MEFVEILHEMLMIVDLLVDLVTCDTLIHKSNAFGGETALAQSFAPFSYIYNDL